MKKEVITNSSKYTRVIRITPQLRKYRRDEGETIF